MRMVVLPAHDFKTAKIILSFLRGFLVGVAGGERYALAVFRPRETARAVLGFGQLHRLAAVWMNDEDLILVADAIAGER
ncbi:MAG: hypothetical protein JMDDDDMK_02890 [Acidobacteria bacterium]|nr:hypothetical protein [Acidobacteriota bacterium]